MHSKKFDIASSKIKNTSKIKKLIALILFIVPVSADSFNFNSYNNHGIVGLINMPTARLYDESVFGLTFYNGNPDQKITLSSNPYDWIEASFFYTNIKNRPYCRISYDPVCSQDYKDKGFNLKLRLKEEGIFPAIAVGLNDFAGTGFYSSEYIVGSYGINNLDIHFGLGWGTLNTPKHGVKNPLKYLNNSFLDRPTSYADQGGQFQPSRYFSGEETSPFFGVAYSLNKKILIKLERDTTAQDALIEYEQPSSEYSFGIDYAINDNFSIGLSHERGAYSSIKFLYKNNTTKAIKKYKYKKATSIRNNDTKYQKFIKNLENNNIGINKILENKNLIGVELTQYQHSNIETIEEIIKSSAIDSGITKDIKKDLRTANLIAIKEYSAEFEDTAELIYEREKKSTFNSNTSIKFRPFLASRESFFKGALLLENDNQFVITDSLFFTSNFKYSLIDNFDDLTIPPVDTFPEQVRSDVKDYLRNIDEGIIIGRAQFDYHITPKLNHHFMFTAGILEDMFSGAGLEYLYFNNDVNYAFGFEIFDVVKRDYKMRFGTSGYSNIVSSANFYYRNHNTIPFDMKFSFGEYLAGDEGATIDFSRSFNNGTKFGVFATFTDVSSDDFGEGSFDKGVYFNVPIYQNFVNYTWRPLTKDPGARLNRKHTLYDLLSKYRKIN